jgi:hypothetical protein
VEVAALAQRDQLLDDAAQILGLGQGRLDLLMLDEADPAMLANMALRCSWVRFSFR